MISGGCDGRRMDKHKCMCPTEACKHYIPLPNNFPMWETNASFDIRLTILLSLLVDMSKHTHNNYISVSKVLIHRYHQAKNTAVKTMNNQP